MKSVPKRPAKSTGAEWLAERERRAAEYRHAWTEDHERMMRELGAGATPAERADWHLAQISDEDLDAWVAAVARVLLSAARRRLAAEGAGHPVAPELVAKPRTRRPNPSRLAKWEAHWQAGQKSEDES